MISRTARPKALSLKDAYEKEHARREMERRKADEEMRARQAMDRAGVELLFAALNADPELLKDHDLTADRRGYQVMLDHQSCRIAPYFEGGLATVTHSRRSSIGALTHPKQETAESVEDALRLIAQFLADEIR